MSSHDEDVDMDVVEIVPEVYVEETVVNVDQEFEEESDVDVDVVGIIPEECVEETVVNVDQEFEDDQGSNPSATWDETTRATVYHQQMEDDPYGPSTSTRRQRTRRTKREGDLYGSSTCAGRPKRARKQKSSVDKRVDSNKSSSRGSTFKRPAPRRRPRRSYNYNDDDIDEDTSLSSDSLRSSGSLRSGSVSEEEEDEELRAQCENEQEYIAKMKKQKKAKHNANERKRRDVLKNMFGQLQDNVPSLVGEKAGRAQILIRTANYIRNMRESNERMDDELKEMRTRNAELSNLIQRLELSRDARGRPGGCVKSASSPCSIPKCGEGVASGSQECSSAITGTASGSQEISSVVTGAPSTSQEVPSGYEECDESSDEGKFAVPALPVKVKRKVQAKDETNLRDVPQSVDCEQPPQYTKTWPPRKSYPRDRSKQSLLKQPLLNVPGPSSAPDIVHSDLPETGTRSETNVNSVKLKADDEGRPAPQYTQSQPPRISRLRGVSRHSLLKQAVLNVARSSSSSREENTLSRSQFPETVTRGETNLRNVPQGVNYKQPAQHTRSSSPRETYHRGQPRESLLEQPLLGVAGPSSSQNMVCSINYSGSATRGEINLSSTPLEISNEELAQRTQLHWLRESRPRGRSRQSPQKQPIQNVARSSSVQNVGYISKFSETGARGVKNPSNIPQEPAQEAEPRAHMESDSRDQQRQPQTVTSPPVPSSVQHIVRGHQIPQTVTRGCRGHFLQTVARDGGGQSSQTATRGEIIPIIPHAAYFEEPAQDVQYRSPSESHSRDGQRQSVIQHSSQLETGLSSASPGQNLPRRSRVRGIRDPRDIRTRGGKNLRNLREESRSYSGDREST